MGKWADERIARLRELWDADELTVDEIAAELGTSPGAIRRLDRTVGLGLRRKNSKRTTRMAPDSRAILDGTTQFVGTIVAPEDSPRLLVDGVQQQKIGKLVKVGRWKGMPFYALTLTERATCPSSCKTWEICYGNNMPLARRHQLTPAIMPLLSAELDALDEKHRKAGGYVVRLHVLGDFGSPETWASTQLALEYVDFWHDQLINRPWLHVFGYTAHAPETAIGEAIFNMTRSGDRCWIRFSGHGEGRFGSLVVKRAEDVPAGAVLCPYEVGKVKTCGDCGGCWKWPAPVAFIEH